MLNLHFLLARAKVQLGRLKFTNGAAGARRLGGRSMQPVFGPRVTALSRVETCPP